MCSLLLRFCLLRSPFRDAVSKIRDGLFPGLVWSFLQLTVRLLCWFEAGSCNMKPNKSVHLLTTGVTFWFDTGVFSFCLSTLRCVLDFSLKLTINWNNSVAVYFFFSCSVTFRTAFILWNLLNHPMITIIQFNNTMIIQYNCTITLLLYNLQPTYI